MNGSPAISSAKRVQRAQDTQRSRSSSTCALTLIGLGNSRFGPSKREAGRPLLIAWFCSGHSPPLSQIGQSSGWLTSRNSMTPFWASSATVLLCWVRTTMPSATGTAHDGCGFGWPSISTRHMRQAATGSSSGWSQKRGTATPIISAARMMSVPFGTATATSSMVTLTVSTGAVLSAGLLAMIVIGSPPGASSLRLGRMRHSLGCSCLARTPRGST